MLSRLLNVNCVVPGVDTVVVAVLVVVGTAGMGVESETAPELSGSDCTDHIAARKEQVKTKLGKGGPIHFGEFHLEENFASGNSRDFHQARHFGCSIFYHFKILFATAADEIFPESITTSFEVSICTGSFGNTS